MTSVLGECGKCHWWARCTPLDKAKQAASEEPCPFWKKLGTVGIESGWT